MADSPGSRSRRGRVAAKHRWIFDEIDGIQRDDDNALAAAKAEAEEAKSQDRADEKRKAKAKAPRQSSAMMTMEEALEKLHAPRPPRR